MAASNAVEKDPADGFISEHHDIKLTLNSFFKMHPHVWIERSLDCLGPQARIVAAFEGVTHIPPDPDHEICALAVSIKLGSEKRDVEARVKASLADKTSAGSIKFETDSKATGIFEIPLQEVMAEVDRSGGLLEIAIQVQIKQVLPPLDEGEEMLPKHFAEIRRSEDFSDFEVVCSERVFKCHKLILVARSEYFRTMFTSEYRETRENRIVVSDVDPETMEVVLRFIYGGEFDSDSASVDVLRLAHMYGLRGLVRQCCNELAFGIEIETIHEILPVAYVLDRESLLKHALAFFKMNRKQIMDGENWKTLASNTDLIRYLLLNI